MVNQTNNENLHPPPNYIRFVCIESVVVELIVIFFGLNLFKMKTKKKQIHNRKNINKMRSNTPTNFAISSFFLFRFETN